MERFDWFAVALVLALHVGVLGFLYQQRLVPLPHSFEPIFIRFITPEPPKPVERVEPVRREIPKPRVVQKKPPPPPKPREIVVEAPPVLPSEPVVLPPPPPPVLAPEAPKPLGPVTLPEELSVSCPERAPPLYPAQSRRLKEQGQVLLRVELDEQGHVDAARIEKPSGVPRLDQAALAAVRGWRCKPATRDGRPVRAIALQPFNFVLD